jgi:hypothetical protein
MRVQFLRREPIEKLKVSLAGGLGGLGFADALPQKIKRHHHALAIKPPHHAQGIRNFFARNKPRRPAASKGVARKEFLRSLATGKVQQEGTKHG